MNILTVSDKESYISGNKGLIKVKSDGRIPKNLISFISELTKGTDIRSVSVNYHCNEIILSKQKEPIIRTSENLEINLEEMFLNFINSSSSYKEKAVDWIVYRFDCYFKKELLKEFDREIKEEKKIGDIFFTNKNIIKDSVIDDLIWNVFVGLGINNKIPQRMLPSREFRVFPHNRFYSFNNKIIRVYSAISSMFYGIPFLVKCLRDSKKHKVNEIIVLSSNFNSSKDHFEIFSDSENVTVFQIDLYTMFKDFIKENPSFTGLDLKKICTKFREYFFNKLQMFLYGKDVGLKSHNNHFLGNFDATLAKMMHEIIYNK